MGLGIDNVGEEVHFIKSLILFINVSITYYFYFFILILHSSISINSLTQE